MKTCKDFSGQQFQDLTVIKEVPNKYKFTRRCWLVKCKCGKELVLSTDKLKIQKSCGCNNIAHVNNKLSEKYRYLYKRWHYYKKLNQLSEEFFDFNIFLNYVLDTLGDRPFSYSYLTKIDENKLVEKDNLIYKHQPHEVTIEGLEFRWCCACERYVQLSDKFWAKKMKNGCKKCVYAKTLKRKYNLNYKDYLKMKLACGNKCEICKQKKNLVVDHNHETGKVRGLLCNNCNTALGYLKEDIESLQKLLVYLDRKYSDIDFHDNLFADKTFISIDKVCPITKNKNTVIDHCHKSGKVRGNIGWSVNLALGHMKDDKKIINSSIKYLQKK